MAVSSPEDGLPETDPAYHPGMDRSALGEYVAAFERRSLHMMRPGERRITGPGIVGTLAASAGEPGGRLLVTDDRAADMLRELHPEVPASVVAVLEPATECRKLMLADRTFNGEPATAMVCRELAAVPAVGLPAGLTLRPIRRLPHDDAEWVPVERAAAACLRSEPDAEGSLENFVAYLCSLPTTAHLFAAVDEDGEVRATAASGCFGEDANAFFVSTDEAWRGRGIATAMTSFVLREAGERGAVRACLDASPLGRGIYERLGFIAASPLTLFIGF
jgi:GNAT superfamily N-acetyltransferase